MIFKEGHEAKAINKDCKTMLLGWFDLNKEDSFARSIKYANLPESYSWNISSKKWIPRKKAAKVVGRIINVSPKDSERFFLKLILNRIPGATCYEDLRTHEGVIYRTYREAAIAMGATESSEESNVVLEEAAATLVPAQLKRFFVFFLIGEEPSDALRLWEKFQENIIERDETIYDALCEIEAQLNTENRTCKDFGLPEPIFFNIPVQEVDVQQHLEACKKTEEKLNSDQLAIYKRIIDCISSNS